MVDETAANTTSTPGPHDLLEQRAAQLVAQGCRIEIKTPNQTVLVSGHRVNHILHLILTLLTLGLWAIVWIVMGLAGGEKRYVLTIDSAGNFTEAKS